MCTNRPACGAAAQAKASGSRVAIANAVLRMCGASSSSKNSSRASARRRSSGSAGYSGGSGYSRSSVSMMRVESPIVSPFSRRIGNVLPFPCVIVAAHAMCIIGIGALRRCGTPL